MAANNDVLFKKYPKIQSMKQSSKWALTPKTTRELAKAKWAVTEKIHGANMCFQVRRNTAGKVSITACSRSQPLVGEAGAKFFAFNRYLDLHRSQLGALLDLVIASNGDVEQIGVFGELFGGRYPHPEVKAVEGLRPVQTGVWYAPDMQFAVFDIEVVRHPSTAGAPPTRFFLALATTLLLAQRAGLFVTPLLKVCPSFQEAIDFDVDFPSRVPALLGLPPLDSKTTLNAEGVVIRPYDQEILVNEKGDRAIIKKKASAFQEDARFHQAAAPSSAHQSTKAGGLSALDMLRFEYPSLLTRQRVDNAISKLGPVVPTDREQLFELLTMVVQDVIEELSISMPEETAKLSPEQLNTITKEIRKQTRQTITDYFSNK